MSRKWLDEKPKQNQEEKKKKKTTPEVRQVVG
jgi:hypothetical protein